MDLEPFSGMPRVERLGSASYSPTGRGHNLPDIFGLTVDLRNKTPIAWAGSDAGEKLVESLVETKGIEPSTFALRTRRSPS